MWIAHHPPSEAATDGSPETFELVIFSSLEVSEVLVEGRRPKEESTPVAWKRLERAMVETLIGEAVH